MSIEATVTTMKARERDNGRVIGQSRESGGASKLEAPVSSTRLQPTVYLRSDRRLAPIR
jgi:hypothetical protein